MHMFFRLLALCHTVMPEDKDGTLYEGRSISSRTVPLIKHVVNIGMLYMLAQKNTLLNCTHCLINVIVGLVLISDIFNFLPIIRKWYGMLFKIFNFYRSYCLSLPWAVSLLLKYI